MLRVLVWAACCAWLLGCTNTLVEVPPEPEIRTEDPWGLRAHEKLSTLFLRLTGRHPNSPISTSISGHCPAGRKLVYGDCWVQCERHEDCGEGLSCTCEGKGKGCVASPYIGPGSRGMRNVCIRNFLVGPF